MKFIAWTEPTVFNQDITEMIENYYGCTPIKLSQNKPADLLFVLDLVRDSGGGVILSGGDDIWPGTMNQQPEHGDGLSKFDILRDRRELFAIDYCFQHDVPIFAICRGFQIMLGAKFGLGLMQDISRHPIAHSRGDIKINEEKGEYLHWVTCLDQAQEEFFERGWVVSRHHQAVYFSPLRYKSGKYLTAGLEVLGTADLNVDFSEKGKNKADIIELARAVDHPGIYCQYHPEAGADYLRNPAAKKVVDYFGGLIGIVPKTA